MPPEPNAEAAASADNWKNNEAIDEISSPKPVKRLSCTSIALVFAPLCLLTLLSSIDLTIVVTFQSAKGYIWLDSAFILAHTAITPVGERGGGGGGRYLGPQAHRADHPGDSPGWQPALRACAGHGCADRRSRGERSGGLGNGNDGERHHLRYVLVAGQRPVSFHYLHVLGNWSFAWADYGWCLRHSS
ncbi:hypothetical protein VTO42DRAFT_6141 [Malbranchea cinnamomea]